MLANVATSYGAPEEVAEIYRDKETQVENALRTPVAPQRSSPIGKFFSVLADPLAYVAVLHAAVAGYRHFLLHVGGHRTEPFTRIVRADLRHSICRAVRIDVRALALVEGRLIESMLGVRMPRRPLYADRGKPFGARVEGDVRRPAQPWSTLLYMVMKLPLGIIYFTFAVIGLSLSLGLAVSRSRTPCLA